MLKIIKESTTISNEQLEPLYNSNKLKVTTLLRFEGIDATRAIPESDVAARLNAIAWHFNFAPLQALKIVDDANQETVLGYLSGTLMNGKFHTGLNLSPYSLADLVSAIHTFMGEEELNTWQGWSTYTPPEKEELINSLGRPDLFEYLGSNNIDPEAEDCVFDYNKI